MGRNEGHRPGTDYLILFLKVSVSRARRATLKVGGLTSDSEWGGGGGGGGGGWKHFFLSN